VPVERSRGGGDYRDLYQPRPPSCTPRCFSPDVLVSFGELLDHIQSHRDDKCAPKSTKDCMLAAASRGGTTAVLLLQQPLQLPCQRDISSNYFKCHLHAAHRCLTSTEIIHTLTSTPSCPFMNRKAPTICLAQHDLFQMVPELEADIGPPPFQEAVERLYRRNAWLGPAGVIISETLNVHNC